MTWVVGGKHLFCARAVSDVRITIPLSTGEIRYFDGVRKTHFIGPNVAVCFAGSIRLGLKIIENLQKSFYPKLDDRLFATPSEIMRRMRKSIIHFYENNKTEPNEKVEMLVFISANDLNTAVDMWKLVSPKFALIEPKDPFEMLELGSGSNDTEFRKIIKECAVGYYVIEKENGEKPDLYIPTGKVGMRFVFAQALDYDKAGISRAMHITLVYPNNMTIEPLPEIPDGSFPPVADTWEEVKKIIAAQGIKLKDCHAYA